MRKSSAQWWLLMAPSCRHLWGLQCMLITTTRIQIAWTQRTAMATYRQPIHLMEVINATDLFICQMPHALLWHNKPTTMPSGGSYWAKPSYGYGFQLCCISLPIIYLDNSTLHAGSTNISHYPLDYLVDYASPTTGAVSISSQLPLGFRLMAEFIT